MITGAAAIVPRIIGMIAAGMEHGGKVPADVGVMTAGAAAIAQLKMLVADMEHGAVHSVAVIPAIPVRIVRPQIKRKPVFEERRPLGRLSDVLGESTAHLG